MAITAVSGQKAGATADNASSVSRAYPGNVTAGNLLVIGAIKYSDGADNFTAGDCTKSAGTATIGTPTLDVSHAYNYFEDDYIVVGVWSVPVTGSGSCTMQVGGALAGSYLIIGIDEFNDADITETRVADTASAQGNTGAPSSGDADAPSDGGAFFGVAGTGTASPTTHTPDAAFTQVFEEEDGSTHMTGSVIERIVSGATTDAASWTAPTTALWAAAVAVYKAAGGGGGGSAIPVLRRHYLNLQKR